MKRPPIELGYDMKHRIKRQPKGSEARIQDFVAGNREDLPYGELLRLKRMVAAAVRYFWASTPERMRKAVPGDLAPICIPR